MEKKNNPALIALSFLLIFFVAPAICCNELYTFGIVVAVAGLIILIYGLATGQVKFLS